MKTINYFKRFLSVLLTVLMMITLLPASVYADDGEDVNGSGEPQTEIVVGEDGIDPLSDPVLEQDGEENEGQREPKDLFLGLDKEIKISYLKIIVTDKEDSTKTYQYIAGYPFDDEGNYIYSENPIVYDNSLNDEGVNVKNGDNFQITFYYSPSESNVVMVPGDNIKHQLPDWLADTATESMELNDSNGNRVGYYTIGDGTEGLIKIVIDDSYISGHSGFIDQGMLTFNGSLNSSSNGSFDANIGGYQFTIPMETVEEPVEKQVTINKDVKSNGLVKDEATGSTYKGRYYIEYEVSVKNESQNNYYDLSDAEVRDFLDATVSENVSAIVIVTEPIKGQIETYCNGTSEDGKTHTPNALHWTFPATISDTGTESDGSENQDEPAETVVDPGKTLNPDETISVKYRVYFDDTVTNAPYNNRTFANFAKLIIDGEEYDGATESVTSNAGLSVDKSSGYYERKLGDDGKYHYYITYNVDVKLTDESTIDVLNDVVVVDEVKNGYDQIENVIDIKRDGVYDPETHKITWTISNVGKGDNKIIIQYTVQLKDDALLAGSDSKNPGESKVYIKNVASASKDGLSASDTNEADFIKYWATKGGEQQSNGTVKFVFKANSPRVGGTDKKPVYNNNLLEGDLTIKDILGNGWEYCDKDANTSGSIEVKRYTVNANNQLQVVPGDPYTVVLGLGTNEITKTVKGTNKNGVTVDEAFTQKLVTGTDGTKHQEFELAGNGQYYYEITYYAKPTPDNFAAGISNKAGVGVGGATTYWHEYGFDGQSIKNLTIEKTGTGVNAKTNICGWKITIRHAVETDMVITDAKSNDSASFYFTQDQLDAMVVTWGKNEDGSPNIISKEDYVVTPAVNDKGTITTFTLQFKERIESSYTDPVVITYDSHCEGIRSLPQDKEIVYKNTATITQSNRVGTSEGVNKYKHQKDLVKTLESSGAEDTDNDGTREYFATWKITVNQNGTLSGTTTVTDTLPSELEYVSYRVVGPQYVDVNFEGKTTVTNTAGGTSKTQEQLTFTIEGLQENKESKVEIYIKTKVVSKELLYENIKDGDKVTLDNKVALENPYALSNASGKYDFDKRTLTKARQYSAAADKNILHFEIGINPDAVNLIGITDDDGYVTVADEMSNNVELLTDTLKLYSKDGNLLFDNSSKYSANDLTGKPFIKNIEKTDTGFTFKVLNNYSYVLKYDVYMIARPGEKIRVSNKVKFVGSTEVVNTGEVEVYKSKGVVEGKPVFTIQKRNTSMEPVNGAEFALYKVTYNNGKVVYTKIKSATTGIDNEAGNIKFADLEAGVIYAYREEKAADGYYLKTDDIEYRYIAFPKRVAATGADVTNLPSTSGLPEGHEILQKVSLSESGVIVGRYNQTTKVTVDKTFVGRTADGTYTFGLFKGDECIQTATMTIEDGKVVVTENNQDSNGYPAFYAVPNGEYKVYELVVLDEGYNKAPYDGVTKINGINYKIVGIGEDSENWGKVTVNAYTTVARLDKASEMKAQLDEVTAKYNAGEISDAEYKVETDKIQQNFASFVVGIVNYGHSNLTIRKELAKSSKGTFSFTVVGEDGLYYYLEDNATKSSADEQYVSIDFSVDGDNQIIIKDIPIQEYTVTEVGNRIENYKVEYAVDKNTDVTGDTNNVFELSANDNGTEVSGTILTVSNTLVKGDLLISKKVTGTTVTNKKFNFIVTARGENIRGRSFALEIVNTVTGETVREDFVTFNFMSQAVITLKANEVATIKDLPAKTTYSVTEAPKLGYRSSSTGESGVIDYVTQEAEFTNEYSARDVSVQFDAYKTLLGRDINRGEFEFELVQINDDGTETVLQTKTNDPRRVTFDRIVYTKDTADKYVESVTYNYKIREVKGNLGGVTYDDNVYNIAVDVTDNGDGALERKVTVRNADGEVVSYTRNGVAVPAMSFTNKYVPAPVDVKLGGTKTLKDFPAGSEYTYNFEFVLMESLRVVDTQTVEGMGSEVASKNFEFKTLTYTTTGNHIYTVLERRGDDTNHGITYDTTVHYVSVKVTDDLKGQLWAEVEEMCHDGDGKSLKFENTYKAKPVNVEFSAVKSFSEDSPASRLLKANEFTFTLTGDNNTNETAYNDRYGRVSFKSVRFNEAGVYHFTLAENASGLGGVTDDSTVYNITVTVTDPGDGQLQRTVTVNKNDGTTVSTTQNGAAVPAMSFVNKYEAKPVSVSLGGTKTLADFPAGSKYAYDFEFKLMEGFEEIDSKTIRAMGSNNTHSSYKFNDITYTSVGEHTYTVVETEGKDSPNGITYSSVKHTVKVVVTDDQKGNLVATVTPVYSRGTGLDFTNTYKAKPVSVEFGGTKTLSGFPALSDVECSFTFTLRKAGRLLPVARKTVVLGSEKDSDTYSFAKTYTEVTTETFVVRETVTNQNGITYDDETYTVTVKVSDPGDGQLVAELSAKDRSGNTVDVDKLDFTNVYKAHPVSVEFKGTKTLTSLGDVRDIKANEFEFTLSEMSEEGQTVVETVRNGEGGAISFSPITYDETGRHVYLVSENDLGDYGIEYSKINYIIEVDVYDDGTGDLKYETKVIKNSNPAVKTEEEISPMAELDEEETLTETPSVIIAEEATITTLDFENIYHHGDLMISNRVSGNIGSKTKLFDFTVRLYGEDGNELDETYAYEYEIISEKPLETDVDRALSGTISTGSIFQLRHGESIIIRNLPAGVDYVVEEDRDSRRGYEMKVTGNEGVIYECEEDEYISVSFRNIKNDPGTYIVPNTAAK